MLNCVIHSLKQQTPLAVVSVGATEAFVMAQYTIYSEEEFMMHPEAQVANMGIRSGFHHRGIRFPNLAARDEVVEAVRQADIVGCNTIVESARLLTENVFSSYHIAPALIFEANIRRVMMFSQQEAFMAMLQGRKVLLIGSLAPLLKERLEWKYLKKLGCDIVGAVSIYDYEEIPRVKAELDQYDFDLCLLAAGVNAVILAPHISKRYGKVALDIGSGLISLMTGEVVMDQWLAYIIGLDRIYKM